MLLLKLEQPNILKYEVFKGRMYMCMSTARQGINVSLYSKKVKINKTNIKSVCCRVNRLLRGFLYTCIMRLQSDDGDDSDKVKFNIFYFSFVGSHVSIFFNATRHLFIARVGI